VCKNLAFTIFLLFALISNLLSDEEKINEYLIKGIEFYKNNQYAEAIKEWEKVLAIDSKHPKALQYIEHAKKKLEEEKKEDKADVKQSSSTNDKSEQEKKIMGETNLQNEKIKIKKFNIGEAIKYYNAGVNKYNQGLFNEAIEDFNKAINIDSGYVKAWYWMSYCYYKLNDLTSAKNICNSLINELKVSGEYKEKTDVLLAKIEEKLQPPLPQQKASTIESIKKPEILTIYLNDGNTFEGELLEIKNNIYTIKTSFGNVQIQKDKISRIENKQEIKENINLEEEKVAEIKSSTTYEQPKISTLYKSTGSDKEGEFQIKLFYMLKPEGIEGDFKGDGMFLFFKYGLGKQYGIIANDLYFSMDWSSGSDYDYTATAIGMNFIQAGLYYDSESIAVDSSSKIYVADTGNNRVQKFNSEGVYITEWSVANPHGIAVDSSGNVYVSDWNNNQVVKFTKAP